jgi:hypothetical protein
VSFEVPFFASFFGSTWNQNEAVACNLLIIKGLACPERGRKIEVVRPLGGRRRAMVLEIGVRFAHREMIQVAERRDEADARRDVFRHWFAALRKCASFRHFLVPRGTKMKWMAVTY